MNLSSLFSIQKTKASTSNSEGFYIKVVKAESYSKKEVEVEVTFNAKREISYYNNEIRMFRKEILEATENHDLGYAYHLSQKLEEVNKKRQKLIEYIVSRQIKYAVEK